MIIGHSVRLAVVFWLGDDNAIDEDTRDLDLPWIEGSAFRDALDLCYTKPHVDTFVIISGDSDFSPLVAKLRENNKALIGCGVKNSTSDLLIASCDEFIFYDDLVREQKARRTGRRKAVATPAAAVAPNANPGNAETAPASRDEDHEHDRELDAFDLVLATIDALIAERGEDEKIWGSMVKQALKRRKPGFNESYYGFRSFNKLLEEAAARRLLDQFLNRVRSAAGRNAPLLPISSR